MTSDIIMAPVAASTASNSTRPDRRDPTSCPQSVQPGKNQRPSLQNQSSSSCFFLERPAPLCAGLSIDSSSAVADAAGSQHVTKGALGLVGAFLSWQRLGLLLSRLDITRTAPDPYQQRRDSSSWSSGPIF